jgi:hypothetical protein
MNKDECCPKFDPTGWENKTHTWENKQFITKSIPQFLHMPLPWVFGATVTKLCAEAEKAGALMNDSMLLAYDPSPWKSELFLSVSKEVPGTQNVKLSGTFITKVFDGPYQNVPKWMGITEEYLKSINKKALKYYFYYTSCPKCAEKWGHNYVVIFLQI